MYDKKILVVDDEPTNLQLLRQVLHNQYQTIFATNGRRALEAVEKYHPDLVLLDIMMPEMDGYEVCRVLKANQATQKIPIIFVSAMGEIENEALGFDLGAVDYIPKPISTAILLKRIKTHLSLVSVQELEDSQSAAIYMLGEAGHYNDTDTGLHIWRMAAYSKAIAQAAAWPKYLVERIELAASMHDTGKIGIPDSILKAQRPLDRHEWEIMKQHTTIGFDILTKSHTPIFVMAAEIALRHHEKWDGTGYPAGLSGPDIPESARIVALADVFDALTSKRPYKQPWNISDAIVEIKKSSGQHFDPRLVDIFLNILSNILEIKNTFDQKEQNNHE